VVVAQLTRLSGETEVSNGGNGNVSLVGVESKAVGPRVFGLVLQFQGEGLVLEVGETGLGGDGGAAKTTSL
jgi:hypothetical protein